ncbi:hypothetical protein BRADI_2g13615v3 [Brachypodium distachyon]|uniref:Secreted protein n=1 Tax=Brachypodium distachyon TaxID=15368 RepID=A0A2K2D8G6_BRADI|nr:hypothetical protein BRADI_2g13615v3 [Brachypodium distachyon]
MWWSGKGISLFLVSSSVCSSARGWRRAGDSVPKGGCFLWRPERVGVAEHVVWASLCKQACFSSISARIASSFYVIR